jgi:hypothetical protein
MPNPIQPDAEVYASNYINESEQNATPANDEGRVPKLEATGRLSKVFMPFGGDGSDGALTVSSGTTTIDLAGAQVVIKNYSSISITGTGKVAFSNPHANGTTIIFRSKGNVTLTSSQTPMLDASGLGANGGALVSTSGSTSSAGNIGTVGKSIHIVDTKPGSGSSPSSAGTGGAVPTTLTLSSLLYTYAAYFRYRFLWVGAGGESGATQAGGFNTNTSGAGGKGGGCLIVECGGKLNFTTTSGISVAGANGDAASAVGANNAGAGGGGGGGGGLFLCFYNQLTASSGTVTVAGGTGGTGLKAGSGTHPGGGGGGNAVNAGSNGTLSGTNGAQSGGNGATGLSVISPISI